MRHPRWGGKGKKWVANVRIRVQIRNILRLAKKGIMRFERVDRSYMRIRVTVVTTWT